MTNASEGDKHAPDGDCSQGQTYWGASCAAYCTTAGVQQAGLLSIFVKAYIHTALYTGSIYAHSIDRQ